jgi:tetratricopeptide (TPR) repeat protein
VTCSKCRFRPLISRAGSRAILFTLLSAGLLVAEAPILPKDAAVREYELGLEALKRKDFRTAIERMNAALATGHTRADEGFGTSRYPLEWYDPYYWLGVAYMELGRDDEALSSFRLSREGGVIEKRAEYADLVERMRILEEREAARRQPPPEPDLATPPAVPPLPTPPFQGARPEKPVAPRPTASAAGDGGTAGSSLVPLIEAIAQGRFDDAELELARVRLATPKAAEPELLAAVLYGSRYVLEGRADPRLLARAKQSLESFRRRGGTIRAEEAWLSPPLRSLLGG